MITVLQQPQEINYSESLPDIELTSDKSSVTMEIKLDGNTLLEEFYDMGPQSNNIKIKLRKLLDHLLVNEQPKYHLDVTIHSDAVKTFQIILNDEDDNPVDIEFKMLNGFNRFQPFDLPTFFRNNWLNLSPPYFEVYFHQPLFLTAFPNQNLEVKIKGIMADGSSKVISVGNLVSNQLQSVNINPGKIEQKLGGSFLTAEVYAVDSNSKVILGAKKLYYNGIYPFKADIFLYLNRLGGWDSLILSGEQIRTHRNTPSNAIIEDIEFQYDAIGKLEFEKWTGFIQTESEQRQFIDFIYSKSKFHLFQGELTPIITNELQVVHSKGTLNSYSFIFRPSSTLEYYPETGSLTTHLSIT